MNRKFNVVSLSTKRVITAIAGGCAALVLSAHLAASTLVNINTASAAAIADALQGIGVVKAQAIVDHRKAHGLFKATEELMQVKGIGKATFEQVKRYLLISGSTVGDKSKTSSSNTAGGSTLAGINAAKSGNAGKTTKTIKE